MASRALDAVPPSPTSSATPEELRQHIEVLRACVADHEAALARQQRPARYNAVYVVGTGAILVGWTLLMLRLLVSVAAVRPQSAAEPARTGAPDTAMRSASRRSRGTQDVAFSVYARPLLPTRAAAAGALVPLLELVLYVFMAVAAGAGVDSLSLLQPLRPKYVGFCARWAPARPAG